MKISKLFHWLYALLMLLPFAFFVPSVFYYAFNDNATMQSVEVPQTETIAVDFNQKIKNGNFESLDYWSSTNASISEDGNLLTFTLNSSTGGITRFALRNTEGATLIANNVYVFNFSYKFPTSSYVGCDIYTPMYVYGNLIEDDNWHLFQIRFVASSNFSNYITLHPYFQPGVDFSGTELYFQNFGLFDLTQMFGSGNEPTIEEFNTYFPNSYYSYTESELMQVTYETGTTEQLIENTSIINYAWESVWDLPLFNWCKVSFVSVPFTYITGLFGLAGSNSFNYVFTYFASMSIIWLVFDVIMYVPLLVHRWLDKGIVE